MKPSQAAPWDSVATRSSLRYEALRLSGEDELPPAWVSTPGMLVWRPSTS